MKNFEIACEKALDDWIDSIEELPEVEYSENHIKKINSIAGGKHVFNVYVTKTLFRVLVAAVIIFSLSIVGFAVKEIVESKKIVHLRGQMYGVENPVRKPVTDLKYGYIPEGFILDTNQSEFDKRYEEKQEFISRYFNSADGHFEIHKYNEYADASHYTGNSIAPKITHFTKDGIDYLTKEYDNELFIVKMTTFTENGINYLLSEYIGKENDKRYSCSLEWNMDGYMYGVNGNISSEEVRKIAKDVR